MKIWKPAGALLLVLALTGCETPEERTKRVAAAETAAAERKKERPLAEAYSAAVDYLQVRHRGSNKTASREESSIEGAGGVYQVTTWIETQSRNGKLTFRHDYVCSVIGTKVQSCTEAK